MKIFKNRPLVGLTTNIKNNYKNYLKYLLYLVLLGLLVYFLYYWVYYPLFIENNKEITALKNEQIKLKSTDTVIMDSLGYFKNDLDKIAAALNTLSLNDSVLNGKITKNSKEIEKSNYYISRTLYRMAGLNENTIKQKSNFARYTCINILEKDTLVFQKIPPIKNCDEQTTVTTGTLPKTNISTSEMKKITITVKPIK